MMFEWWDRVFKKWSDGRPAFFRMIDGLNADGQGGTPITVQQYLGMLPICSGTVTLGDPMDPATLGISGIQAREAHFSATLWKYPSGSSQVNELRVRFDEFSPSESESVLGQVWIDAARLVVVDEADYRQHWTNVGLERIGMVKTNDGGKLARDLKRRFGVRTVPVIHGLLAKTVEPISPDLERRIEEYLKSSPEYPDDTFWYFRLETMNSFERCLNVDNSFGFIPVGNEPEPRMFVCGTGRGDGTYDVVRQRSGDITVGFTIRFIDEE